MMNEVYGPFLPRSLALEKGLKWYFNGNACKHGHVAMRQTANYCCQVCSSSANAANCKQWYKNKGKAQVIKSAKQWAKNNPNKRKDIANKWANKSRSNPEYVAALNKNRRTPAARQKNNERRAQYFLDPQYRIKETLRVRVRIAVKAQNSRKYKNTFELMGCSWAEFKNYFENLFQPGMTWENHGLYAWHIDHIRPCASFDLADPEQQKQCFHYTNLQPLWAEDNLKKSDKWSINPDFAPA